MKQNLYLYKVKSIDKVVDGDTVILTVDLGFYLSFKIKVRLKGFDAPEIFRPANEKEKEAGFQVKEYLTKLLVENQQDLFIKTSKVPGIYGRWEGEIFIVKDGKVESVNSKVINFINENKLDKQSLRNLKG